MTFRAVFSSESSEPCVLSARRFHQWELSFIDPQRSGNINLERRCVHCGRRQHADGVPGHEARELPRTLWCLGDWSWQEGEIQP
jgi:hypothetical protein